MNQLHLLRHWVSPRSVYLFERNKWPPTLLVGICHVVTAPWKAPRSVATRFRICDVRRYVPCAGLTDFTGTPRKMQKSTLDINILDTHLLFLLVTVCYFIKVFDVLSIPQLWPFLTIPSQPSLKLHTAGFPGDLGVQCVGHVLQEARLDGHLMPRNRLGTERRLATVSCRRLKVNGVL